MKTVAIYIGDWKPDAVDGYFNQLVNDLGSEGVEVLENTSEVLRVIQTPKVYITFIDDLKKFEGRRFDRIFGNLPGNFINGRLKDPVGRGLVIDIGQAVVDYVVSVEFRKETEE